ncbi:dCTP deaminase [Candidatus Peregrinibacteria bacterium]|jgi:dCTP deaminase|nr:dCTP deaminase [Candidatus Peregrinibacteria bacterium]MBT7484368.1 dCTP deaminase [Candidatus Peregrinibacteria bacterium]MBT7703809.1 dCTP deaminase [Candidatus Peregrinibacteria bacterium]
MILSDRDIKARIQAGDIVVTSPNNDHMKNIHASSMDFRLGKYFKVYNNSAQPVLDPAKPETLQNCTTLIEVEKGKPYIVQPGEFVLGVTLEKIKLPNDLVARVEGRSSLGRLGIIIHSTAGFIDAGFEGTITLEITNINRMPIALHPGMRVCQFAFETMSSEAEVPYHQKSHSKYQGQELPEESRITIDPEFK